MAILTFQHKPNKVLLCLLLSSWGKMHILRLVAGEFFALLQTPGRHIFTHAIAALSPKKICADFRLIALYCLITYVCEY